MNEEAQATHPGLASSSLHIWDPTLKWKPRVILTEGTVSVLSHKESEVTMLTSYTPKEMAKEWDGGLPQRGDGQSLPQVMSEQETWSEVASTYYLKGVGGKVANFSRAQLQVVIIKVPWKKKMELGEGLLKSGLYVNVWGCGTGNCQSSNSE